MALAGCGEHEKTSGSKRNNAPIVVEAVEVKAERFVYHIALTGQLEAEYSVLLKPEMDAVVEEIFGTEGQPVSKGEILFRLRDAEPRALLARAEAEERLARDIYDRTQRLLSQDISSKALQAEALAELDVAKAQTNLRRVHLDRTRIRAPFDGVLGLRRVAPGARLDEKDGLITVEAIDRLQLIFTSQEMAVALARVGARIYIRVIAYPGERFPGDVFYVSPTIDPATRRLIMKAWIPNPNHRLKPGMFANVDVDLPAMEGAILLPDSAMVYDRHGVYVWRVGDEGTAEKVPIEIGLRQDGRVQVTSGVAAGDWVVSAGTNKVMAGSTLQFSKHPSETAPRDGDLDVAASREPREET
jgi:membrane fusion protein (multidrug efflux system)